MEIPDLKGQILPPCDPFPALYAESIKRQTLNSFSTLTIERRDEPWNFLPVMWRFATCRTVPSLIYFTGKDEAGLRVRELREKAPAVSFRNRIIN